MDDSPSASTSTRASATPSLSPSGTSLDVEAPRRTRRRFTSGQLVLLEQLYYTATHPTREEREALASSMCLCVHHHHSLSNLTLSKYCRDLRAVTVWFQNKRQLDRKSKADPWAEDISNSTPSSTASTGPLRSSTRLNRTISLGSAAFSSSARKSALARTHSLSTLSLDRVATRLHAPTTPPRKPTALAPAAPVEVRTQVRGLAALLENFPPTPESAHKPTGGLTNKSTSTPEAARTFVEFGRRKRCTTLEWACAAARLAPDAAGNKEHGLTPPKLPCSPSSLAMAIDADNGMLPVPTPPVPRRKCRVIHADSMDTDETDDEHEAITPRGSLGGDATWGGASAVITPASPPWKIPGHVAIAVESKSAQEHDEETMRAALALCGLGQIS